MSDFNWYWLNGTFIITMTGIIGGGCGACLAFLLKSRCSRIKLCCGGVDCVREPLSAAEIQVMTPTQMTATESNV